MNTTLDQVIAANEELVLAIEGFEQDVRPMGFGKISFALEEAQDDVKEEKKKSIMAKFMEYVTRFFKWIRSLFSNKKEKVQESMEKTQETVKEMSEEQKKFRQEMEEAEAKHNLNQSFRLELENFQSKHSKEINEKFYELFAQNMPRISSLYRFLEKKSPAENFWTYAGEWFDIRQVMDIAKSAKSTLSTFIESDEETMTFDSLIERIKKCEASINKNSDEIKSFLENPTPSDKSMPEINAKLVKDIFRFNTKSLGTFDIAALNIGDIEELVENVGKSPKATPAKIKTVQEFMNTVVAPINKIFNNTCSTTDLVSAEFRKYRSLNIGIGNYVKAMPAFGELIDKYVEPMKVERSKLESSGVATICAIFDNKFINS